MRGSTVLFRQCVATRMGPMLRLVWTRGPAWVVAAGVSSERLHQAVQRDLKSQTARRRTLSSPCLCTGSSEGPDSWIVWQEIACTSTIQGAVAVKILEWGSLGTAQNLHFVLQIQILHSSPVKALV